MSIKANFFKIGIFVIVTFAMLAVGVVFWGAKAFNQEEYFVETYTEESVQGLTVGSPVYLRGVQIGDVAQIAFISAMYDLPEESEAWENYRGYVYIKMSLNYGRLLAEPDPNEFIQELVDNGFRLRTATNPLTGIAFLQADLLDPNEYPPLPISWKPTHAYIPSALSLMGEFVSGVERTMKRLDALDIEGLFGSAKKTLTDMDQAILDVRVGALSEKMETLVSHADTMIVNANSLIRSTGIPRPRTAVEDILNTADGTLTGISKAVLDADVRTLSKQGDALLLELRDSNQKLQTLLRSTESTKPAAAVDQVLLSLNEAINQLNLLIKQLEPGIQAIVNNGVDASENLKQSTDDIKQQPSKLLFSEPPAHSEVMQ